jgi:hypothetical protein
MRRGRQPDPQPQPAAVAGTNSPAALHQTKPERRDAPAGGDLPAAAVLAAFSETINQFIERTRPFGLKAAIHHEQITYVRTNNHGRTVLVGTKNHLFELHGNRVIFFMSNSDCLQAGMEPTARSSWYQATAPWTKDQAFQETYAIMDRLGIKAKVARVEYDATPLKVRNPAGDNVEVTPFHTLWLHMTNDLGAIEAQFRMGTSGPGHLTRWMSTVPDPAPEK